MKDQVKIEGINLFILLNKSTVTAYVISILLALENKLAQLPVVDVKHAPAKLPSKLHLFAFVNFLEQSLCSVHSDCALKLG